MTRPRTRQQNPNDAVMIRLSIGISQDTLAEMMGLCAWTIMRYETGKRAVPMWYMLALKYIEENIHTMMEDKDVSVSAHKAK